jgi:hypothetical protein
MSRAEAALLRPTSFWRGTVALGGLLIEVIGLEARVGQRRISLVLADVDGTSFTEEKILMERAWRAGAQLRSAGIRLAIASGRPPLGMAMPFDPLDLGSPGGLFVERYVSILEQKTLPADVAGLAIVVALINSCSEWLITKGDAPHAAREALTVKFEPKVVADFDGGLGQVSTVGVNGELDQVKRCEAEVQALCGERTTANRLRAYYLDIAAKDANKGATVDYLSLMTVDPGLGGQVFLLEMLSKVHRPRRICAERRLHPVTEVDGGENVTTAGHATAVRRNCHRRRLGDFRNAALHSGHRCIGASAAVAWIQS